MAVLGGSEGGRREGRGSAPLGKGGHIGAPLRITFILLLFLAAALSAQTRTLDDFATLAGWTAAPSDGVRLDLAQDQGALRLDFDFNGGAGYAVARRPLPLDLPANWEISFRLRADAPVNNLEFKLIDPTGQNVWWMNRRGFEFPRDWRTLKIKKRQLEFAWGPAGGGEMKQVAALEIAITAGTGGKGTVWIDDLKFTELPPAHPYNRTPAIAISGDTIVYDFLEPREYGGLVIDWERPSSYAVSISDDGKAWTKVREVVGGNGGRDYLYLPETESRYLRLRGAGVPRNLDVKPLDWAPSINAFFAAIARDAPHGAYPRSFSGEQEYWTVVGVDGDREEALLGEDGALEVGQGAFSIEPFLFLGRQARWRADLLERRDDLPVPGGGISPHPHRDLDPWRSLARDHRPGRPDRREAPRSTRAIASAIRERRSALRLFLALRPFQVNPPTQFLNATGGVSAIREIAWDGHAVDGRTASGA